MKDSFSMILRWHFYTLDFISHFVVEEINAQVLACCIPLYCIMSGSALCNCNCNV